MKYFQNFLPKNIDFYKIHYFKYHNILQIFNVKDVNIFLINMASYDFKPILSNAWGSTPDLEFN